jgi:hypothetical protein
LLSLHYFTVNEESCTTVILSAELLASGYQRVHRGDELEKIARFQWQRQCSDEIAAA